MSELYPLKLAPLFYEKPWGGEKIKLFYPSYDVPQRCGEAWLVSGIEGKNSVVTNGFLEGNEINELIEVYMEDLIGEQNFIDFGEQLPVLIKMIDTSSPLSIQVHPDDALAQQLASYRWGKNEMWYILQASTNSYVLNGFSRSVDVEKFLSLIESGAIVDTLNRFRPKQGDFIYVKSRRIHAIGPGITLIEIQQPSDITYRVFDWNRKDEHGNPRELHIKEAMETIDWEDFEPGLIQPQRKGDHIEKIIESPHFSVNKISIPREEPLARNYMGLDSFVVWVVVKGMVSYQQGQHIDHLHTGEVLFIPAAIDEISFYSKESAEILEIYRSNENEKEKK